MASNPSQGKLSKPPQLEEVQSADYQSLDKSSSNTLKVLSCLVEDVKLKSQVTYITHLSSNILHCHVAKICV